MLGFSMACVRQHRTAGYQCFCFSLEGRDKLFQKNWTREVISAYWYDPTLPFITCISAFLHVWFHHDMWGAHQTRCLTFHSFSRSSHLGSCHGSELGIFPTRKGSWTLWWRVAPWLRGSSVRFLLTSPCEWAVCDGTSPFLRQHINGQLLIAQCWMTRGHIELDKMMLDWVRILGLWNLLDVTREYLRALKLQIIW